jgi:hypothetical protein
VKKLFQFDYIFGCIKPYFSKDIFTLNKLSLKFKTIDMACPHTANI